MNIRKHVTETYDNETLKNIVQHGCVSGSAHDLVYYSDTCTFYDVHKDEIWDMLYNDANDQGLTIMELIASFNGQKDVGSHEQFKNLLSWYAVERVAHELLNEEEIENV